MSIRDTPPDLNVTMELHGLRLHSANRLSVERMAEYSLGDAAPDLDLNYNVLVVGPPDCMCQVFYHRIRSNYWRIVFAFFPKNKVDVSQPVTSEIWSILCSKQNVKPLYHNAEFGPSVDLQVLQHEVVDIAIPKIIMGWTVRDKQLMSVSDSIDR